MIYNIINMNKTDSAIDVTYNHISLQNDRR